MSHINSTYSKSSQTGRPVTGPPHGDTSSFYQDTEHSLSHSLPCVSSVYVRGLTVAVCKVEYPGLKEQGDGRGRKQTGDAVIKWRSLPRKQKWKGDKD